MTYSERIEKFYDVFNKTGSVYQAGLLIPDIVDDKYFEGLKPEKKVYTRKKYEMKTSISLIDLENKLSELAKVKVEKKPIFSYFKRKKKFIEENKESTKKELELELEKQEEKNKAEFDKQERMIEKRKNAEYEDIYKDEMSEYKNIFNPSQDWLDANYKKYFEKIVKKWGNGMPLPCGSKVTVEKNNKGENRYSCVVYVDNLSMFADSVPYKYSITQTGRFSQRLKTDKQIEEEYAQNVCSIAFICSICLFNVCLDIKEVLVSTFLQYIDESTGNEEEKWLYSVIVPREIVKKFKMENLNTVAALTSLEGKYDIRKEREIYFIEPIEWDLGENKKNSMENSEIDFTQLFGVRAINYLNLCGKMELDANQEFQYNLFKNMSSNMREEFSSVLDKFNFGDEINRDDYVDGIFNFGWILTYLKKDKRIFGQRNKTKLKKIISDFYGNNFRAIEEFNQIIDDNIFVKFLKGENVEIDPITEPFLLKVFTEDDSLV